MNARLKINLLEVTRLTRDGRLDEAMALLRGAIPGAPGGYVVVRKALTAKPEPQVQAEKAGKVTIAKKPVKAKK